MSKISASKLCAYVDAFSDASICVFGDVILDEYIHGSVSRVSPEAPIVVVEVEDESIRLGGAANVAHNIATLGAKVSLCGVLGEDEAASRCINLLEEKRISTDSIVIDPSRPTTRKTRVIGQAQQIVRIDREVSSPVPVTVEEELYGKLTSLFKTSASTLISDYKKGVVTPGLSRFISEASASTEYGFRKRSIIVDPKGNNYAPYYGASCVKPNRKEASEISGVSIKTREDALRAAQVIMDMGNFESVMITLGEMGMVLIERGQEPFELDTIAQEIYDVSGAGDTVLAVFSLSLAVGALPHEAATIANCAAARVIREVGTAAIDPEDLKEVLRFWEKHQ